jgi:plastocyanin
MSTVARLRSGFFGLVALLSVVILGACGGQSLSDITPEIGVDQVAVEDNRFGPRVIQVNRGTTVTWTWTGDRDHNVVGEGFKSGLQSEGTFAHTFDTMGSFRYLCTLHGGMTGAVIVTE